MGRSVAAEVLGEEASQLARLPESALRQAVEVVDAVAPCQVVHLVARWGVAAAPMAARSWEMLGVEVVWANRNSAAPLVAGMLSCGGPPAMP